MDFTQIGKFLLDVLSKYGWIGVCIIVVAIFLISFGHKLSLELAKKIVDSKITFSTSDGRKLRKDSVFKINRILTELLNKLDASRCAIFEYHNGGQNLTGLPFLHFSITHQTNAIGTDNINEKEFNNLLVSMVPDFITNIDRNTIDFVKDIEELKLSFPKLYKELALDGMTNCVFAAIEGVNDSIGFLLVCFKKQPELSKTQIIKELMKKTLKISTLLDYKNAK